MTAFCRPDEKTLSIFVGNRLYWPADQIIVYFRLHSFLKKKI